MGRDYGRILREKGIVLETHSRSPAVQCWNAWSRMDKRQRQAFCVRAGLMPIPPAGSAASLDLERHATQEVRDTLADGPDVEHVDGPR
jgi:hypothetical protein